MFEGGGGAQRRETERAPPRCSAWPHHGFAAWRTTTAHPAWPVCSPVAALLQLMETRAANRADLDGAPSGVPVPCVWRIVRPEPSIAHFRHGGANRRGLRRTRRRGEARRRPRGSPPRAHDRRRFASRLGRRLERPEGRTRRSDTPAGRRPVCVHVEGLDDARAALLAPRGTPRRAAPDGFSYSIALTARAVARRRHAAATDRPPSVASTTFAHAARTRRRVAARRATCVQSRSPHCPPPWRDAALCVRRRCGAARSWPCGLRTRRARFVAVRGARPYSRFMNASAADGRQAALHADRVPRHARGAPMRPCGLRTRRASHGERGRVLLRGSRAHGQAGGGAPRGKRRGARAGQVRSCSLPSSPMKGGPDDIHKHIERIRIQF